MDCGNGDAVECFGRAAPSNVDVAGSWGEVSGGHCFFAIEEDFDDGTVEPEMNGGDSFAIG